MACTVETGDDLTNLQPLDLSGASFVSIDATEGRVTVADPVITSMRLGHGRVNVAPERGEDFKMDLTP